MADDLPSIDTVPDVTLDVTKDSNYQLGYSRCKKRLLDAITEEIERIDLMHGGCYGIIDEDRIITSCEVLREFADRIKSNDVQI